MKTLKEIAEECDYCGKKCTYDCSVVLKSGTIKIRACWNHLFLARDMAAKQDAAVKERTEEVIEAVAEYILGDTNPVTDKPYRADECFLAFLRNKFLTPEK